MTTLKSSELKSAVQWCSIPLNRTQERIGIPQPQPGTWVQLLALFNPYCYDEALLLCQISNWEWVAWIPDHGEAVINIEQFCFPAL